MNFSLLTYNILFNKASAELQEIFKINRPDIFCLQEVETDDSNLKKLEEFGYKLADFSNSFIKFGRIFGVATYYDPARFEFVESKSIKLPFTIYEIILIILKGGNKPRTVLRTDFIDKKTKREFTVYNLHFSVWATNEARNKQMRETLTNIDQSDSRPIIVSGDFNYPYGRKKFEEIFRVYGFKEATNNLFFSFEARVFGLFSIKLKDDYVLYRNIQLISTKRISFKKSDHYPITAEFDLK
jgi:endonuclease/exonuclease/phosphatase family metal-dependent hydrolase